MRNFWLDRCQSGICDYVKLMLKTPVGETPLDNEQIEFAASYIRKRVKDSCDKFNIAEWKKGTLLFCQMLHLKKLYPFPTNDDVGEILDAHTEFEKWEKNLERTNQRTCQS